MSLDDTARTRVVLRPIASPLVLGFLGLAGGSAVLAAQQLGWFHVQDGTAVALVLITFAFPLQLLTSVLAFHARDGGAATGMGLLAATWLATGVLTLTSPPGATSPVLGHCCWSAPWRCSSRPQPPA